MKLTERKKEILGLSLAISSITLTATAAAIACRKSHVAGVLGALAVAQGAAGTLLLVGGDEKIEKIKERVRVVYRTRHPKAEEDVVVEEVFDESCDACESEESEATEVEPEVESEAVTE